MAFVTVARTPRVENHAGDNPMTTRTKLNVAAGIVVLGILFISLRLLGQVASVLSP